MQAKVRRRFQLEHWEIISMLLMAYDLLAVIASYFGALWLRFDCRFSSIDKSYLRAYCRTIMVYVVFCVVVFIVMRLYKSIWRFVSYVELMRIIIATIITGVVHIVGMTCFVMRMTVSYYVFGLLIQFYLTFGIRFLLIRTRRFLYLNYTGSSL